MGGEEAGGGRRQAAGGGCCFPPRPEGLRRRSPPAFGLLLRFSLLSFRPLGLLRAPAVPCPCSRRPRPSERVAAVSAGGCLSKAGNCRAQLAAPSVQAVLFSCRCANAAGREPGKPWFLQPRRWKTCSSKPGGFASFLSAPLGIFLVWEVVSLRSFISATVIVIFAFKAHYFIRLRVGYRVYTFYIFCH